MNEPPGTHPCVTLTVLPLPSTSMTLKEGQDMLFFIYNISTSLRPVLRCLPILNPLFPTDMGSMYMIFYFYLGYLHAC
ncbi:hypothetical protein BDQ17DRAFT_1496484 [Cyathus striatus]|nr:hypothetical protein BDQ17DRAFT_1496484 [Cyathus striatus]